MIIVGLTGSIAMGKSAAARAFRRLGVPVHDADAAVRQLLAEDPVAIARVAAAVPGAVKNGAVDRAFLAARVFADAAALGRLEAILHPLVRRRTRNFLELAARRREKIVVLDVPLLFETGAERACDVVVVVNAPAFLQARRFLARPEMTQARLAATRARQTPAGEKLKRADVVVQTGLDRGFSFRRVAAIVAAIKYLPRHAAGRAFARRFARGGARQKRGPAGARANPRALTKMHPHQGARANKRPAWKPGWS
ncbi:MAG: dephospho-CoA kinase [Rhodospirillales bacterium]|nr:dephospho-CoA kinase [Rhodospirillales bacterium]MSP80609.1 dephospho-CoA kinase [Rhodospirillales bacterium]